MRFGNKLLILLVLLSFIVTACGAKATPDVMDKPEDTMIEHPTEDAMMAQPTEDAMMSHDTPMPDAITEAPTDTMLESPAWFSASLTNVHTGEAFTLNDLKGKVVLVETMAVWCSNCYQQQTQVKALHASLGERDDFVSIGFDIDPNEDADLLKTFVGQNGFDWRYVVAPTDVSREIASLYGGQFLNPPSTPMLIIDRHGVAHPLPFGIKGADELMQALQPYLDEGM